MGFCVLVLHGPNLSLLAAEEIDPRLEARADELGLELISAQANGEEGLLDALHDHAEDVDAVLVNPGAIAPSAWALAEGLQQLGLPAVEVLLKPPAPERGPSSLTGVVKQQVHGLGVDGYVKALEQLVPEGSQPARDEDAEDDDELPVPTTRKGIGRAPKRSAAVVEPVRAGKSIGRKPAAPTESPEPEVAARGKTIGRGALKEKVAVVKDEGGVLTRAQVRARIALRLKGEVTPDQLAQWAREKWSALQRGAEAEAGRKDTIETVLLTLMAGAKASDAMLVAQMAKLDS
jgi:3-dehydroquinate dehydratase-2